MVDHAKGEIEEISLDMSLDDVEDLPGFGIPLTGAYQVSITTAEGEKLINEKKAINYEFKIDNIMELMEEPDERLGEEAPKVGDTFSSFWFRNNKYSIGLFKKFAAPLAERLGVRSLNEILQQSVGLQLLMIIKRKKDKKDKDVWRMEIKKVVVL